LSGQVVKRYAQRHVSSTSQRVVRGTAEAIGAVLEATATGTGIHTAYIERLNATFRSHLAPLVRRGRAIAHTLATLQAGMWLVGVSYSRLSEASGTPRSPSEPCKTLSRHTAPRWMVCV